jgi:hypothetical protein
MPRVSRVIVLPVVALCVTAVVSLVEGPASTYCKIGIGRAPSILDGSISKTSV